MSWGNKTKISSGTWNGKTKIITEIDRGRILTPDNNQILVGATQSDILIWQEATDTWNRKVKIAA